MVTDPYDDDDDQPTLQRPAPGTGQRSASGIRAAVTMPVPADEPLEYAFGEETTAVDLTPLSADDLECVADVPSEAPLSSPADGEMPTPSVPLDVARVMLELAGSSEQLQHEREE